MKAPCQSVMRNKNSKTNAMTGGDFLFSLRVSGRIRLRIKEEISTVTCS